MAERSHPERRLAAVLVLDVAGYSRLMGSDEEGTHARVGGALRDVAAPLIGEHRGRIFKRTGDGLLAEFSSVIDAARCAIAIQDAMAEPPAEDDASSPIRFRIGLNLGDVIVDPPEIYGDGVNIAVCLEALAQPGGICVSQTVADQVGDKLRTRFIGLGEQNLKDISRPVRVFRMVPADEDAPRGKQRETTAAPGLEDRPAIAVLPFVNRSGDSDQEYFADGLTEDIIAALASWRGFPVIARNSMFTYKGRAVDIRTVGRETGAHYVVEGTLRRQGARLRISVSLSNVETSHCVFAERYDRDVTDIFAVQDEISMSIVGELEPELLRAEGDRAARAPQLFSAYDFLQRGLWHHYRYTDEDSISAQDFFRKSLEADPGYAEATAALAIALVHRVFHGWETETAKALKEALALGQRAVSLDRRSPQAHYALALGYFHTGSTAMAMREMEEVIRLHPSHAAAWANLGNLCNYVNQPERATRSVLTALRLSPSDPRQFIWLTALAGGYYLSGLYSQAIEAGRRGYAMKPDFVAPLRYVVASLGQEGRRTEAGELLPALRRADSDLAATEAYLRKYYADDAALQLILAGLRKAGFT
jgi:adenylate cyclase